MKSEWKIQSQYFGEDKFCQVYRQLDMNKPLHSGNMEHADGVFETIEEAMVNNV